MITKPIALVGIAAALVAAAGTGAYLAVRQNTADEPVIEFIEPAGQPVHSTEAAVEPDRPSLPEPVLASPAAASPSAKPTAPAGLPARSAPPSARPMPETDRHVEPVNPARSTTTAVPTGSARAASSPSAETRRESGTSEDAWPQQQPPPRPDISLVSFDGRDVGVPLDPETRPRLFKELVVAADSVIGLQIETAVSTEQAKVEDRVDARVTRDVIVGEDVAIPAGTRVLGSVVLVDEGGKVKEVARLGVRFHTVVMDDGSEVPIVTETVYREGKSPAGESAAKIGGAAVGGAILGAILGGTRGAVIGGSAGAAGGTAAVMAADPNPATLAAGSPLTVRLSEPATVTVEQ